MRVKTGRPPESGSFALADMARSSGNECPAGPRGGRGPRPLPALGARLFSPGARGRGGGAALLLLEAGDRFSSLPESL